MESLPLDGDVLILAGGRANVTPDRLVPLVRRAQAALGPRFDDYDRRFECVHADDARALFLVPRGHWAELGAELEIEAEAADALRRAHEQQLLRVGSNRGRREEFETAMEIREVVVVGR
ncbi:hypothetical protein [Halogeometricum luteum]|uniref:DUF8048 domain-containing protein n=1 Tax=Halogeometricum luteum TaxID=2950537 RepID=A0ABU2FZZ7_9EURY|nr:hypothetical protein [Halogeometricum sp. S3BR5-2]MDS0294104.1 hypothetical protein [Halogeometricum sp. S3BR5-2]